VGDAPQNASVCSYTLIFDPRQEVPFVNPESRKTGRARLRIAVSPGPPIQDVARLVIRAFVLGLAFVLLVFVAGVLVLFGVLVLDLVLVGFVFSLFRLDLGLFAGAIA
jgi:hypothetical protein